MRGSSGALTLALSLSLSALLSSFPSLATSAWSRAFSCVGSPFPFVSFASPAADASGGEVCVCGAKNGAGRVTTYR